MQFIDDQDLVMRWVNVRKSELRDSSGVHLPELIFPCDPNVLTLSGPLRLVWRRVRASHEFIAPLRNQPIGDDDQRAQVRALTAQRVQDHERLNRLTQTNLIRK
jgi:hypothetical protein